MMDAAQCFRARPADEPNTQTLSLFIASDLHAYEGAINPPPSGLKVGDEGSNPLTYPVPGFEALATQERLTADLLLCPGDLGDHAQAGGVTHGWAMIQRMAKALGDATVLATTGNHDVMSRPPVDGSFVDPVDTLRKLSPRYPHPDRPTQQAYFGDSYAIVPYHDCRIVLLNTSTFHGQGDREYSFGRISPTTRQQLLADLDRCGYFPTNILLCHHHPIEYTALDEPDRSSLIGGAILLNELSAKPLGPWLVIHGHKHIPNLAYGPGSGGSAVIFSAGSMSASLHLNQQSTTRNQVYRIEIDQQAALGLRARLVGRFKSWYWVQNRGWLQTTPGSGLPAEGGFGFRGDPRQIAHQVSDALVSSTKPALGWNDLIASCPGLEFLIPSDLEAVRQDLELLGCGVRIDDSGRFEEVVGQWKAP